MFHVLRFEQVPEADKIVAEAKRGERVNVSRQSAQADQVGKNLFFAASGKHLGAPISISPASKAYQKI
jgi:hypothetical protein